MRARQGEKKGRGSSTVKGVWGSGVRDPRRWIAIEIERALAITRSERVKQQKTRGRHGRSGATIWSTGKGKRVRERDCRVRGERNK